MRYLLTALLCLFLSLEVTASDVGEDVPLLRKVVNYSAGEQFTVSQPNVVVMSEGRSVRPIAYRTAECIGRSVAHWNYAYPDCCLKKGAFDKFIPGDSDDHHGGAGAMLQGFSILSCLWGSTGTAVSATCCLVCGYGGCCHNSTQCCVCSNACCINMAANVGCASGGFLCGALCCGYSVLFCRQAIPIGVPVCNKLGCSNCAEGLLAGHKKKKTEIMDRVQLMSGGGAPAQITMGYQNSDSSNCTSILEL